MTPRGDERQPGELVGGKYRLLRFLAAGGMGVVYEAQHTVVKRRFAVKFLRPELAEKRENLRRFQREAQAAGELESEHLAAAVDFGVSSDGSPFIVMEYLVGESVDALLTREGPLALERAAELVSQACRGIQAAHAASIVHRDLKPQNLFLCRRDDGTDLVKVLDFGVAKLEVAERGDAATETGTVLGTPAYMSPEQARGEKTIDHRADVYALGAILYELVSGRKPHPGESHNAILHHIATQPAVPLDFVEPALPPPLVQAIERALSSEPGARFDSVELFSRAIAVFAERRVWPAPERTASSPTHEASEPTELEPKAVERARARTVELLGPNRDEARVQRTVPRSFFIVLGSAAVLVAMWLLARSAAQTADIVPAEPAARKSEAARPAPVVNAAEAPLPVAARAELAPTPSFEALRKRPSSSTPARRVVNSATRLRPAAPRPEATHSAAPLAFDRQNPYD